MYRTSRKSVKIINVSDERQPSAPRFFWLFRNVVEKKKPAATLFTGPPAMFRDGRQTGAPLVFFGGAKIHFFSLCNLLKKIFLFFFVFAIYNKIILLLLSPVLKSNTNNKNRAITYLNIFQL